MGYSFYRLRRYYGEEMQGMSNYKIFLCSFFKEVRALLETTGWNIRDKKVAFIPTASNVEKVNFFVKSGMKLMEQFGSIIEVVDINNLEINDSIKKIEEADIIYVSGGNTFYLLAELKRTGIDSVITSHIKEGKIYIGESAGAMIVSKNIEYVKALDSIKKAPGLVSLDALNLLDFVVLPHFEEFPFVKATQKVIQEYSNTLNIMKINNKQAVIIDGDIISTLSI